MQKTFRRLIDEKLNPLLHDYNLNDKSKVLAVKSKLNEILSTLQKVNNEVLGLIEDEDAYEDYQNKADDFATEIEEVIINIDSIIFKQRLHQLYTYSFSKMYLLQHHIKTTI